ncbi:MAG: TonB-dependent receptor [Bacteroidales bacterium]|nr:TonB-dependent receptor [Bacteroidales bacterium]
MKKLTLVFLFCVMFLAAEAQNVKILGFVKDSVTNNPISFVNVVLLANPDSTFVMGTLTSENGGFTINANTENDILQISCIGYKTKNICVKDSINDIPKTITVLLTPDVYLLECATISASPFVRTAEGIIANIQDTPLSKLGSSQDVIKNLPNVHKKGDLFEVFGKGTPIIYIDNKVVRDLGELDRINSSDIKQIIIIDNPGAEYDATTNAVIKIKTVRHSSDGIGIGFFGTAKQNQVFSHIENLDISFRKGETEIFGALQYVALNKKINQKHNTSFGDYQIIETVPQKWNLKYLNPTVGFNRMFSKKHSVGLRYDLFYEPLIEPTFIIDNNISVVKQDITNINLYDHDIRSMNQCKHSINAYYNHDISDASYLKLDADYIDGRENTKQAVERPQNESSENLCTNNERNYFLYAGKLVYVTPLFAWKFKSGGEYAHTLNNQKYTVEMGTLLSGFQSSKNKSEQDLGALFCEFSRNIGLFSIIAGLRYEHVDMSYYANDMKDTDASKIYDNLFPSVTIGFSKEKIHLSLAYRRTTNRPSYENLRNNIAYDGPYTYARGNPLLKNTLSDNLTCSFDWKSIHLKAIFSNINDKVCTIINKFDDNDTLLIFEPINISNYKQLSMSCVFSPSLKIWKPMIDVSFYKQYLNYGGRYYNEPILSCRLNSRWSLPRDFFIGFDLTYSTKGHKILWYYYDDFSFDLNMSKSFFKEKLTVSLSIENLFDTHKDKYTLEMNGITMRNVSDMECINVQLSVIIRFNKKRSSYKGESSSTDEIRRLN